MIDSMDIFQSIAGTVTAAGILWVLRKSANIGSDISIMKVGITKDVVEVKTSLGEKINQIEKEISAGFREINGRLGRVEEGLDGHKRLDDERFQSAHEARMHLSRTLESIQQQRRRP